MSDNTAKKENRHNSNNVAAQFHSLVKSFTATSIDDLDVMNNDTQQDVEQIIDSYNPDETIETHDGRVITQKMKDIDALVAKELNELSVEERNEIFYDLHSVSTTNDIENHKELLDSKLKQLQIELDRKQNQSSISCAAYDNAVKQNKSLVTSRQFLLRFLRADSYDPAQAATRVINYFEILQSLFPNHDNRMMDKVSIYDLGDDDMEVLKSGYLQLLPSRDQGGRPVVLIFTKFRSSSFNDKNVRRVYWYIYNTAVVEDKENQKIGITQICFTHDHAHLTDPVSLKRLFTVRNAVPLKSSSFHICYDKPVFHLMTSFAKTIMGKQNRTRFRSHFGNLLQVCAALQTFGIPSIILPISVVENDGAESSSSSSSSTPFKLENHLEWVQTRMLIDKHLSSKGNIISNVTKTDEISNAIAAETTPDSTNGLSCEQPEIIHIPRYYDVLFGRGQKWHNAPGNVRLRKIVDMYRTKYDALTSKEEKGHIVNEIVDIIHNSTGRFLRKHKELTKENNNGKQPTLVPCEFWIEVDRETARGKVSQTFRSK